MLTIRAYRRFLAAEPADNDPYQRWLHALTRVERKYMAAFRSNLAWVGWFVDDV